MLELVLAGFKWTHIIAGMVGLIAFWVPVFAKKGAVNHVRFGRFFVNAGFVVAASGLTTVLIKTTVILNKGLPFSQINNAIGFLSFLGYLAIIVAVQLYYGVLVFSEKKEQTKLATPFNFTLAYGLIATSLLVIAYALILKPGVWIVLLSLSPIGLLVGNGMRTYISGKIRSKRQWWYEHMTTFLTCGIAFHTAFAVFGASRLFEYSAQGPLAVIPWIAPTLIGVPATIIWQKYYRKKFNDPIQKPEKSTTA